MKNIVILGSTGSIGTQTLDVLARHPEKFKVVGLSAGSNINRLQQQITTWQPRIVSVASESDAGILRQQFPSLEVLTGPDALTDLAAVPDADLTVISLVGAMAIKPTIQAIQAGKDIALATKEVLVAAGEIITRLAKKHEVRITPIDSEHSAIAQCIGNAKPQDIQRIILTASGGPFLNKSLQQLSNATPRNALKHPNWDMGAKISIDSATMMNKGLEVIEAYWLFQVPPQHIEVVIHPQSIIHSMVEFVDGSTIAQLGQPDMRLPIQYALSDPDRFSAEFPRLDFTQQLHLDFLPVDVNQFPCLQLAYEALTTGGTMPCVLNAANEIAVHLFLKEKIGFMDIFQRVQTVMAQHTVIQKPSLETIFECDRWARETAASL